MFSVYQTCCHISSFTLDALLYDNQHTSTCTPLHVEPVYIHLRAKSTVHFYCLLGSSIELVNFRLCPSQDGRTVTGSYSSNPFGDGSHEVPWAEIWFQEELETLQQCSDDFVFQFSGQDIDQLQDAKGTYHRPVSHPGWEYIRQRQREIDPSNLCPRWRTFLLYP